jgi:hypothetical protein
MAGVIEIQGLELISEGLLYFNWTTLLCTSTLYFIELSV